MVLGLTHETRFIPYPFEKVFEESKNALIERRFRIVFADLYRGTIHCTAGESERAWFGEKLELYFVRQQDGTQITIKSEAKGPMLTTFGKSDENIEDFFLILNRRLQQPGQEPPSSSPPPPSGSPPPPPPPQAEPPPPPKCPKCNNDVRYIPQYYRWYCDQCQQYL